MLSSASSMRHTVTHHVWTSTMLHHFTLLVFMVNSSLSSTSSVRHTVTHHVRMKMVTHHFTMLVLEVTSMLSSASSMRHTVTHHVWTSTMLHHFTLPVVTVTSTSSSTSSVSYTVTHYVWTVLVGHHLTMLVYITTPTLLIICIVNYNIYYEPCYPGTFTCMHTTRLSPSTMQCEKCFQLFIAQKVKSSTLMFHCCWHCILSFAFSHCNFTITCIWTRHNIIPYPCSIIIIIIQENVICACAYYWVTWLMTQS